MARKPIIAGNWKMYKTAHEAATLVEQLWPLISDAGYVDVVLCPPFTAIGEVAQALGKLAGGDMPEGIALGAQNMHWEAQGAFTGEVAAPMLRNLCVEYVIIGHSERRQFFGETNETVNKKVKAAFTHKLTPIMCVGELLSEREAGQTFAVVEKQIREGLYMVGAPEVQRMVMAYEPVWAIGTGKTATPAQAQEVHAFLRQLIEKLYNKEVASTIRLQYGGSVKSDNIAALMQQPDIDGALVGGASLKAEEFAKIVKLGG
jgi:triosephosphate isomerase